MTIQDFERTLDNPSPPKAFSIQMQSLWWDRKGDWTRAHDLIDQLSDSISAHIHAYLHRVEGDLWNARYWYNRARQPEFSGSLEEESTYLIDLYG